MGRICIPPLRERRDDIRLLFGYFAERAAKRFKRDMPVASSAVHRHLQDHDWPGNIRELQNVLEHAVTLCDGPEVHLQDLAGALQPAFGQQPMTPTFSKDRVVESMRMAEPQGSSLAKNREDSEYACISDALIRCNNNRLRVASELGISRMTLYKKLHKYGLMNSRSRS